MTSTSTIRRTVLPAIALAVTAVAIHAAWLGWDQTYQVDPATGTSSGPYEAWQVVGCVLSLVLVALVAGVLRRPRLALAVLPIAFTVAWSIPAASVDETGLWGVGALGILLGTAGGAAVVAFGADEVRGWARA